MRFAMMALALGACVTVPPPTAAVELVGSRTLSFADPITGAVMEAVAFYPPAEPTVGPPRRVGMWDVAGRTGLAPATGRRALVVISHGHLGSRYGHHDLATALARAGTVVVAVEHKGDSYSDGSLAGTERLMLGRPRQVSAAIDAALADEVLGAMIDGGRIGVAGFSAGGYTALAAVGAIPDFTRGAGYCARHPRDRELCGEGIRYAAAAPAGSLRDPRVRAAFVMAPLALFFTERSLSAIDVPVFLSYALADDVLIPEEHARRVEASLPTVIVDRIAGAWHSVYLAPCDGPGDPSLCRDPPGVDRRAEHRRLNEAAVRFFENL